MSSFKMNVRQLPIFAGLIVVGMTILLHNAAGLLQGSDGTPDGTLPTFSIEPISLVIGIAAGGLVVGIPALAHIVKTKKSTPTRDGPDQDCDGLADDARKGNKGWDGTIKGVKAGDNIASDSKEKVRPGRESPTLASSPPPDESIINPIAMDKGLRFGPSGSPPSGESLVKAGEPSEKKHTKTGHVTLMK